MTLKEVLIDFCEDNELTILVDVCIVTLVFLLLVIHQCLH